MGTSHQNQYTNISIKGKNYTFKLLVGSCQFEFRTLQMQANRKTFEDVKKTAFFISHLFVTAHHFFVMPDYP